MSLGAVIGWLAGSVLRIRRRHVEAAMKRAGVGDARAAAKAMYRGLGVGLVELLRTRGDVTIDEAALDRDGPVVLFASHTGNWELAASAAARFLATRGRTLSIVAKPMHSAFVDRVLRRLRAKLGVSVIPPAGAISGVMGALARGDVVAMPIDQVPERGGIWAEFLGAPALVDRAPAAVAWRARATALVIAEGRVIDVIPAPTDTDGRAWIDQTALRATAALERHIRERPASWMWLHRRWKDARARPLVALRLPG